MWYDSKIGEFLDHRSALNYKMLLEEQAAEPDEAISRMKAIRKTIKKQHETVSGLIGLDMSSIRILDKKSEHLVTLHTSKNIPLERVASCYIIANSYFLIDF